MRALMRVKLTPGFVMAASKPAKGDRIIYWDKERPGFGLMVTAAGHRSYVVQYRDGRLSYRMHLKAGLNLSDARKEAKAIQGAVAKGKNPLKDKRKAAEAATNSFKSICEKYLERDGGMLRDAKGNRILNAKGKPIFKGGKVRSADQRAAILDRHVYPRLGAQPIDDIRRTEITRMLDQIADQYGASMADHVLAVVRRVMSWHASRSDDYRSPIVRGMSRTSAQELARKRTLSDDELRAVWKTADDLKTPFARMLKFILLTGVRRNEAARMDRGEIDEGGWLIPAARFKGKRDFLVPLSDAALAVLAEMPVIGSIKKGPVFTHDGKRPLSGFGKAKAAFDKDCNVYGWTIHDLRRTARTLMTRAGVDKDHAERCLGHAIGGVRGVYDRHEYYDEKKRAFKILAQQIDRIVRPTANVVQLRATEAAG
jgi:integrase